MYYVFMDQQNLLPKTQTVLLHNKISFPLLLIFLGLIIIFLVGLGGYYLGKKTSNQLSPIEEITPIISQTQQCTMDAKICPDGSSVGRSGPNCEFTACPSIKPATAEPTLNQSLWKTYIDPTYHFQVNYPPNWITQTSPGIVNFRQNNDNIPAESGYSLFVTQNKGNKSLVSICQSLPVGTDFNGILCDQSVKVEKTTINGISWEKIIGNTAGFVPTGNVIYATTNSNLLYYFVEYNNINNTSEVLDKAIVTFHIPL